MGFFKNNRTAGEVDFAALPRHVAIIMDGNGRWAQKRGLPRTAGHLAGAEAFRRVANYAQEIGISYLTVYAFSTENWKRPPAEVEAIMTLLERYLHEAVERVTRDGIRMQFFGEISQLSPALQNLAAHIEAISEKNDGCQVNLCINYGGRDEILRGGRAYGEACARGEAPELTEAVFSGYLYSAGIPDPDLLIRPGGEKRLSNFLLWQAAYAEFYSTDVLWPDFGPADLDAALAAFQNRERRYGGV